LFADQSLHGRLERLTAHVTVSADLAIEHVDGRLSTFHALEMGPWVRPEKMTRVLSFSQL